MRAKLCSLLNGITLIGLGVVLLDFFFTGRLDQYLHPQFRPWTLVGGIIFCIAGTVYAAAKTAAQCCIEEECIHPNANSLTRSVIAFAVLFLPLAAGVALSKDSYDQHAVLNRGFVEDVSRLPGRTASPLPRRRMISLFLRKRWAQTRTREPLNLCLRIRLARNRIRIWRRAAEQDQANPAVPSPDEGSSQYLPKAADGNVALEVTDLLYAESEDSLRKMFSDKTIEVLGQYLPGSDPGQFKLVRMFIVCCAADARPIAVPVKTSLPTNITEMSWVKVIGKATYAKNGDRVHVLLKADTVERSDPPAEAMLY